MCMCVCVQASKHIAHRNTHPSLPSVSVCHNANPLYATQHYSPHPKWHTPLSLLPLSSSVERWQFATAYTSLLKMLWHVSSWILIHIFMLHLNFFVSSRLALKRWDFTSLFACSCCLMWKLVWWFIFFISNWSLSNHRWTIILLHPVINFCILADRLNSSTCTDTHTMHESG